MSRRGMTLVELLLVTALTAVVVGAVAGLYGFTISRLGHATANYASTMEAVMAASKIDSTVRNASSCTTYTSGASKALVCTMPANGTDVDGDGFHDLYTFSSVTKRGIEKMGTGRKVWFYQAGPTGSFGSEGSYLWRAQRSDSLAPTGSDVQTTFTQATSTQTRYPLVSNFDFQIDEQARLVSFTITASALSRDLRKAQISDSSDQMYTHSETRKAYWRNATK